MKKGLIITDYGEGTGIGNYAIDLYKSLVESIDIDLLNLYNNKGFIKKSFFGKNIFIGNYYYSFFSGKGGKLLSKYLEKNNVDYIILGHQGMGYLIPYIPKGIEIITVAHDFMSYNIYRKSFLHFIFRKISTDKILKSDKIVFISEETKRDFYSFFKNYKGQTQVINNFIDDKTFHKIDNFDYNLLRNKYNIDKKYNKIFITVTNGQSHKNDVIFLNIAKEYNDFLFIKVGFINIENKNFIKEKNINNILNLNNLTRKELCELYNLSDIYINTSKKEGFGYPPFEALFCGCKLLTTNSIDITKNEGIYIVDNFDKIGGYKDGIKKLLSTDLNFLNKDKYLKDKFVEKFIDLIKK